MTLFHHYLRYNELLHWKTWPHRVRSRERIYLVTYSTPSRIEVHICLVCELFDLAVFIKIRFAFILDIMIEREDKLLVIVDLRRANGHEF